MRLGYKFKVFKAYPAEVVDPKNFNTELLQDVDLTPHKEVQCPECGGTKVSLGAAPDRGNPPCGRCKGEGVLKFAREGVPNFLVIPPHSYVLGESVETFDIPRDVLCVMLGKSTYARCGIIVNATPGEPGWKGKWTIEIGNTTPLPVKVYAGEGIAQCLFFRIDERDRATEAAVVDALHGRDWNAYNRYLTALAAAGCEASYADKGGSKYQDQTGVTPPRMV